MPGHVFVIQGRMEALVKDAVVVTTDADFTIEPHWEPVLGDGDPAAVRPQGWGEQGRLFGRASSRDGLWFLNVWDPHLTLDDLLRALSELMDDIAASGLKASAGRALPVVAIPVPGIGGGAFRERAGGVIAGMLSALWDAVRRHDLDVVIVATTSAQFAAVQRERRVTGAWPLPEELLEQAAEVGHVAAEGNLALFLGAGVSVPAGLPSWSQLVEELRTRAVATGARIPEDEFAAMDVLDQTELLRGLLGDRLETLVQERFRPTTPALSHALLAGLRCREAVTTNYDSCYEAALAALDPERPAAVMPWEKPEPGRPWLLKMHGDVHKPGSVVLTRGQVIRYDSEWRPVGSVFQSLLMTRRLLVVGASLSDDNVLRLAHEVRSLRRRHGIDGPLGNVLTLGRAPLRAQLWQGELDWIAFESGSREEQARDLEIFLDAVAMHAWHTSPYLLDPDYADLLNEDSERELVELARQLAARIDTAVDKDDLRQELAWRELRQALRSWGAEA